MRPKSKENYKNRKGINEIFYKNIFTNHVKLRLIKFTFLFDNESIESGLTRRVCSKVRLLCMLNQCSQSTRVYRWINKVDP